MNRARCISLILLLSTLVMSAIAVDEPVAQTATATGSEPPAVAFSDRLTRRIMQHSPLRPVPADPTNVFADDPRAARLGHFLFFDTELSANGEISCATCHDPAMGFGDGKFVAEGLEVGTRNSPTVWNVAFNRWYFWDGRADSLWSQALGPLETAVEMGSTRLEVAHRIARNEELRRAYERTFGPLPPLHDASRFPPRGRPDRDHPESLTNTAWVAMSKADQVAINRVFSNVGKAIAAYERLLVASNAPFDRFVAELAAGATPTAIPVGAQRGLKLFVGAANCRMCHSGPHFSDGEFHDIGMPPRHGRTPTDTGRYQGIQKLQNSSFRATGAFSDAPGGDAADRTRAVAGGPDNWGRFKTPSLRNVARTAPYMHQGQKATLADVVQYYSSLEDALNLDHHQEQVLMPLELTSQEMLDLIAFLESLTDETVDPSLLRKPESPILP